MIRESAYMYVQSWKSNFNFKYRVKCWSYIFNLGFFLLKPNYFNQISLWYSIILFLQCYILYFKCHGHFFQGHPEPNPNTFSGIIFETTKKTTIISLLINIFDNRYVGLSHSIWWIYNWHEDALSFEAHL